MESVWALLFIRLADWFVFLQIVEAAVHEISDHVCHRILLFWSNWPWGASDNEFQQKFARLSLPLFLSNCFGHSHLTHWPHAKRITALIQLIETHPSIFLHALLWVKGQFIEYNSSAPAISTKNTYVYAHISRQLEKRWLYINFLIFTYVVKIHKNVMDSNFLSENVIWLFENFRIFENAKRF